MVLDHAPVTGLTVLVASLTAAITGDRYTRPPHRVSAAVAAAAAANGGTSLSSPSSSGFANARRRLLESIPIGGLGAAMEDMALTVGLLLQARWLERRWGSNTYLAFLLTGAATGVAATHMLWGIAGHGDFIAANGLHGEGQRTTTFFTAEAVRVLTGAASLVPLTALVTRYLMEIPSSPPSPQPPLSTPNRGGEGVCPLLSPLLDSRTGAPIAATLPSVFCVPGTALSLADAATLLLPLLKLILFPNGTLQQPTHKRDGVVVSVGAWTRVLLALIGVVFGLASARARWLRWWIAALAEWGCGPLLSAVRPFLLSPIFGSPTVATHAVPPHLRRHHQQQRHHQRGNMGTEIEAAFFANAARDGGGGGIGGVGNGGTEQADGGRISVGSLSGGAAHARPPRMFGPPPPQRQQQQRGGGGVSGGRDGGSAPVDADTAAAVARIQEMGLPHEPHEIAAAVRACGGDVAAAVELLLVSRN